MALETELAMVERHVREGKRHVARQHEIIEVLRRRGANTDTAETLLVTFETALAAHVAHLTSLK